MTRDRRKLLVLALVSLVLASAGIAVAAHISNTTQVSGGVTLVSPDGMEVTLDGTTQANLEDISTLGGTVNVVTEDGNATVYSSGEAAATLPTDQITGTYTNATNLEADPNTVQIDPADKTAVTVGQEIDAVAWAATQDADDGTVDFAYSSSGPARVTLNNVPASTDLYAVNQTGYILEKASSDSGGSVTFDTLEQSDSEVRLQTDANDAPTLSNASPQGKQTAEPDELSVDVSDPNLGDGDAVTVVFEFEGEEIDSQTITSNQTVTAAAPDNGTLGGSHSWSVEATDDFGGSTTDSYTYSVPSEITFRDEQAPHEIVENGSTDPVRVEAIFYEDEDTAPTVINKTTTDGTIDLDGLPVGSAFSVSVVAPGYNNRTVRLDDIYEQSDVFLIASDGPTTVENRFVVDDRTGEFPPEQTEIGLQAPVNESIYDSDADGFEWVTVSGDDLGADQAYVDDLIEEKRYRIVVQNDEGDTRILGSYTPETTGTIELTIGSVTIEPSEPDGVVANATWYNGTGGPEVRVEYNDSAGATDTLYVDIYERGNESNVLVDNRSFDGPYGTFSLTEDVPADENETTWVVEIRGDRGTNDDGEAVSDVHFKEYAGSNVSALNDLPSWLVTVIFTGLIWGVAGLFSQVNGHVGGIVVAGLGGMLYFVGIVPDYLGGGVVALSLLTAGILFVRESRSGAI